MLFMLFCLNLNAGLKQSEGNIIYSGRSLFWNEAV